MIFELAKKSAKIEQKSAAAKVLFQILFFLEHVLPEKLGTFCCLTEIFDEIIPSSQVNFKS